MDCVLTKNQREYVLFHLDYSFELSPEIRDLFLFGEKKKGNICFYQSTEAYNEKSVLYIDDIPILFPGDRDEGIYTFNKGTLEFHHDILKSAFYLLSGYQEYASCKKDKLGRFPYDESIQYKLGFLHKPIVNYFFEWIGKGIEEYCLYHKLPFKKKELFKNFGFFLTHDIDRIDKYNFHLTKNKLKNKKLKEFFHYALKFLNPFDHDNPYWSFDYLLELNKKYDMTSTYFFLNRGVRHIDSYYHYSMKRISKLIKRLEENNCEIGLHGTVKSADDSQVMQKNLDELNKVSKKPVIGNRQHRLSYIHPLTIKLLGERAIKYDSTLGFAGHEGFRNSYCLPFHLYDFENDEMLPLWEIPLIVMDSTIFDYRKLSYKKAHQSIKNILGEINRFNGIFTLLWHNSYCDKEARPGICGFYDSILKMIHDKKGESLRGKDILERIDAE